MTDDMPPDPWEGELPDFPTEWTETHRDFAMLLVRGNLDAEAIVGEHDFEKLLHAVMAMDEEHLRAATFMLVLRLQTMLGGGSSTANA